jgi:hypothetical protein
MAGSRISPARIVQLTQRQRGRREPSAGEPYELPVDNRRFRSLRRANLRPVKTPRAHHRPGHGMILTPRAGRRRTLSNGVLLVGRLMMAARVHSRPRSSGGPTSRASRSSSAAAGMPYPSAWPDWCSSRSSARSPSSSASRRVCRGILSRPSSSAPVPVTGSGTWPALRPQRRADRLLANAARGGLLFYA